MDTFEKIAYTLLGMLAALYIVGMFVGMLAILPFGLPGLAIMAGIGVLFIKVVKERLANKEDDYYERKVEK